MAIYKVDSFSFLHINALNFFQKKKKKKDKRKVGVMMVKIDTIHLL